MKLKNQYFLLSKKEQKLFQIKLAAISIAIIILLGMVLFFVNTKLLFLLLFVISIVISMIAPFYDIPSLVENGQLKYHSLFLLAEKEKKEVITIHGGTLFDYYFVFSKEMTNRERTKLVLLEYLKGLKNIIKNTNENTIIQGTSYIINERTAHKVGLKKVNTNGIQNLILLFNYFNLMVSISLVKKSIHFPNLKNIQTFEGQISAIKSRELFIDKLIDKLEKD